MMYVWREMQMVSARDPPRRGSSRRLTGILGIIERNSGKPDRREGVGGRLVALDTGIGNVFIRPGCC
jgi:hypothetical protein